MVVVGGFGFAADQKQGLGQQLVPFNMSDVWTLQLAGSNVSAWRWKQLTAVGAAGVVPTPRAFATSTPIGAEDIFVTGGWDRRGGGCAQDPKGYFLTIDKGTAAVWSATNLLTEQAGDTLPFTVAMAGAVYDAGSRSLYMVGGSRFPQQDMFWPPDTTPDDGGGDYFTLSTHEAFKSGGAATAMVTKITVTSKTNVTVRVDVDEMSGVALADQGRAPYPRVGQSMSLLDRQVLMFGGLAPFSMYFYNSSWFGQFGQAGDISELISWRIRHQEDEVLTPTALHSGAAVASMLSPTTPSALWHIGGATLTYESSSSLWMYLFPISIHVSRVNASNVDVNEADTNRWHRRELRHVGSIYRHPRERSGSRRADAATEEQAALTPREYHTAVLLSNEALVVFGGRVVKQSGAFSLSTCVLLINLTHPAGTLADPDATVPWFDIDVPPQLSWRSCHAATALDATGSSADPELGATSDGMALSGGLSYQCDDLCNCTGSVLDDVWLWSLALRSWHQLPSLPTPLYGHAMATLFVGGRRMLYVFGGATTIRYDKCDLAQGRIPWVNPVAVTGLLLSLDVTDVKQQPPSQWAPVVTQSSPGPRYFPMAAASSSSKLVVYGGHTCTEEMRRRNGTVCEPETDAMGSRPQRSQLFPTNGTWYFQPHSPASGSWHLVEPAGLSMPLRVAASATLVETLDVTGTDNRTNLELNWTTSTKLFLYGGIALPEQATARNDLNQMDVLEYSHSPSKLSALTLGCGAGYASCRFMNASCSICAVGTFAAAGSQRCTSCSEGTTTPTAGSTSLTDCSECLPGHCHDHGTCAATAGVPACECSILFDDGDQCQGLGSVIFYSALAAAVICLGISVCVCSRKVKRRDKRLQRRESIYEGVLQKMDDELVQLQNIFKIEPESITLLDKIAEGSYGEVSSAKYGSFVVAVKMIKKELIAFDEATHTQEFLNEIDLLRGLRHENIVFFYGWGEWHDGQTFFVTEYCSLGSLREVLDNTEIAIPVPRAVGLVAGAAKGMAFLHGLEPPRLHRDIKAENILVGEDWTTKITDFGSARLLGDSQDQSNAWLVLPKNKVMSAPAIESRAAFGVSGAPSLSPMSSSPPLKRTRARARSPRSTSAVSFDELFVCLADDDSAKPSGSAVAALMSADVGTLLWLAPEVMSLPNKGFGAFRKTVYGKSADIFSFGIVMFEVMTRRLPYIDMPEVSVLTTPSATFKTKVMAGLRPRVPPFHGFPGFFMELMETAWHKDPQERPSFAEMTVAFDSGGVPW